MAQNKLKQILESEGIRQSELRGVSLSTISKVASGKRTASPTTYAKIVKALNAHLGSDKYEVGDVFPRRTK